LHVYVVVMSFMVYSNLLYTQLYPNLFNTQLYSIPKCATYKKTSQKQAITFNHLPRHLNQLGCPRQFLGHLLLGADQNNRFRSASSCWNCTRAHSPCFFVRFLHIRYRAMSRWFLLSSSHPLFLIEHHSVSETYLHNANIRSKPTLILKILPQIPNNSINSTLINM